LKSQQTEQILHDWVGFE